MSILADHEIAELCIPPETYFDHALYIQLVDEQAQKGWPLSGIEEHRKELIAQATRATTKDEKAAFKPMISPFESESVRFVEDRKILSYGCSSYGYDVRVADEFKIFSNINSTIVDPLAFDSQAFVDYKGPVCIIPPNSFVLARTVERFCLPEDVIGICTGKSSIARCGITTLVTPLEPGWTGYLTLEFANTTPLPAKLYANMGGLQINFFRGSPCKTSYAARNGKYQDQAAEITLPRV